MNTKTKIALIGTIIVSLFLYTLYTNHKINVINDQVVYWQNQAALKDTTTIIDSTLVKQLAIQVDKLKSDNKSLNKILNKQESTIQSQLNIILSLQFTVDSLSTTDSTIAIDGDTTSIRVFEVNKNGVNITGYFEKFSPWRITFSNISVVFDLEANIVENKDGTWQTFVDTNNPLIVVNNITTKIIPYEPTWKEKLKLGVGAYVGKNNFALFGQGFYSRYGVLVGYSTTGIILGGTYFIK